MKDIRLLFLCCYKSLCGQPKFLFTGFTVVNHHVHCMDDGYHIHCMIGRVCASAYAWVIEYNMYILRGWLSAGNGKSDSEKQATGDGGCLCGLANWCL